MNEAAAAILREFAGSAMPPGIALMRLMLATSSPAELEGVLSSAWQSGATADERRRMREVAALLQASPSAWNTVRATAAVVSHECEPIAAEAMVQRLAQSFDAAARTSPEASVALYSLGDGSLLDRATGEIAGWLLARGVLGGDRELLDLGCGIGRLERAVGGAAKRIVGLDISAEMIRIAQQRCAGLPHVEFRITSGLDLLDHPDCSFDGVVAVDAFPYLVQAGRALAARHIEESARVLRPGGDLVIMNYSYRGSPDQDLRELCEAAADSGLDLLTAGERPFQIWDATVFHLRKRG